jgi:hypothetical protein
MQQNQNPVTNIVLTITGIQPKNTTCEDSPYKYQT